MITPNLTLATVSMDADPQAFANQVYRQVLAPLLHTYAGAQQDQLNAFVGALCTMCGCLVGSLAAATSPEYAAGVLRDAADSCDELPDQLPDPAEEPEHSH